MPITKHSHQVIDPLDSMDNYYDNTSNNSDNNNNYLLSAAMLLGMTFASSSLGAETSDSGVTLADTPTSISDISAQDFGNVMSLNPADINGLDGVLSPNDLSTYSQMSEDLKQQGRIEDPNSIENKAFNNSEQLNDKMGMFADPEAYRSGALDSYIQAQTEYGATIQIPWDPTGDNTCEECQALADDGPYDPDSYPDPPHYGCQCNDPMADPIIVFPSGDDTVIPLEGEPETPIPPEEATPVEPYQEIDNLDNYVDDSGWDTQLEDLNQSDLEELESYKDEGYEVTNEYLRTGEVPDNALQSEDEIKADVSKLDNIISDSKTPEDMTLYRGVGDATVNTDVGSTIEDPAFMSTSTKFGVAEENAEDGVIMEIQYPKGSDGLPVSQALENNGLHSPHANEEEVLLPRSQTFEVTGKTTREGDWGSYDVVQVKPVEK